MRLVKPKGLGTSGDDFGTQVLRRFGVGQFMWASRASRGVMRLRLHVKGREWDIGGLWMLLEGGRFSASQTFERSRVS